MLRGAGKGENMAKGELLHGRTIDIRVYELQEGLIEVEGTLRDERFKPYVMYSTGVVSDGGVVHDLVISLVIEVPAMRIVDLEVKMPVAPMEECREVGQALRGLVGAEIKPGFTSVIKKRFGGTRGCLHLNNLLLAMSSAAIQGMWTYFSARRMKDEGVKIPRGNIEMVVNSCRMWREDGPLVERIRRRLDEEEKG